MKVEVEARLEAVGPVAWNALHHDSALRSPFLAWTWQTEWVRAFGDGRRLEIWKVLDGAGRLIAALPLYEAAPDVFRIVGGTDVSDYLDLLVAAGQEEAAWQALLEARGPSSAQWDLHCVPAASPTASLLPSLASAVGLAVARRVEERCPVIALPDTWDDYLAMLSGKQRHELTRKVRRAAREVPEAAVSRLDRPDDVELRIGDFLDLHRRSSAGKARFMDGRMETFFRRTAAALARAGTLRLWFLDAPEGPLASYMTIEWDATVGLYNSGFRPDRASVSPGVVLLASVIREAVDRGCRRFDFLRGEERYKYDLGAVAEDVLQLTLGPAAAGAAPGEA
jgi:CelD/BcsL family acetyltransferase involved in cellulose biosynthesis